jgi:hypothetical protein
MPSACSGLNELAATDTRISALCLCPVSEDRVLLSLPRSTAQELCSRSWGSIGVPFDSLISLSHSRTASWHHSADSCTRLSVAAASVAIARSYGRSFGRPLIMHQLPRDDLVRDRSSSAGRRQGPRLISGNDAFAVITTTVKSRKRSQIESEMPF